MPPRRGKKAAVLNQTLTAEEEERNQNCQLLLEDIRKFEDEHVAGMIARQEAACKSIISMFMIEFMKSPSSVKALTLDQYMEKVGFFLWRFG